MIRRWCPRRGSRMEGHGLVPASAGWFVLNARDARWFHRPGRGESLPLTGVRRVRGRDVLPDARNGDPGASSRRAELHLPLGDGAGGLPRARGRGAADRRRGRERRFDSGTSSTARPGRGTRSSVSGDSPCVLLAASSRQFQKDGPWGFYCADEVAARYNASSPEETQDGDVAYGRFPPSQPGRYRDGSLPG